MAAQEEAPISYEELAEIEREFEDAETEIIRQQVTLTAPIFAKRAKTVAQIPNFWPLVIEQAPPDIDEFIQPSDSALLLSSLQSISVSHFELASGGDPRSVSIRWEFSPNDVFEDRVLEKKFWQRRSRDGWAGLCSEPVEIRWKKGRDLTHGLLGMVKRYWDEEQAAERAGKKRRNIGAEQKALQKKIEKIGLGGVSFFAWFGYVGPRVSAEESRTATEKEDEKRRLRREGKEVEAAEDEEGDDEEEDDFDWESIDIFPDGEKLAYYITDDLWPGAIKYFTQAQEQEELSDDDFESDEEELPDAALNGSPSERPSKKRKP